MTDSSSFIGFTDAGDDVTPTVTVSKNAPQLVCVRFTLPNFTALPDLYLSAGLARALRDRLTCALVEIESAIIAAATPAPPRMIPASFVPEPFTRTPGMVGPNWAEVAAASADAGTLVIS